MTRLRHDVERFMRECERFFGFAHQNGGLTVDECDALKFYSEELATHVSTFCGTVDEKE